MCVLQNGLQEVNRLGNFLGIENKDGLFEAICEKCEFGNMVKDKHNYQFSEGVVLDDYSFYRKGKNESKAQIPICKYVTVMVIPSVMPRHTC